jgi:hypothetical protein
LDAVVQENLGMAMIYNLVTTSQEWLAQRLRQAAGPDPEAERKRADAEEEARHAAMRAHGHQVTVETFLAWKKKFDAEMAAQKAAVAAADGGGKGGGGGAMGGGGEARITGKAWFLRQAAAGEALSGSEEEDGEESADFDAGAGAQSRSADDDEDDDEDYDFEDDEDEDDEDMLEQLLAEKAAGK